MGQAVSRVSQTWRDMALTGLLVVGSPLTGPPGLRAPFWVAEDLPRVSGSVDAGRWPSIAWVLPPTVSLGEVFVAPDDLLAARQLGQTLRVAALGSGMRTGAVLMWDNIPVEILQAWLDGRSEEPHPAAACWLALIGGLQMPHLMAAYPTSGGLSAVMAAVPRR